MSGITFAMTLDDFWRANYSRMVAYVSSHWSDHADVEEVVADVIYERFYEYLERVEDQPGRFETIRHWMNRRALLDLRSRYVKEMRQRSLIPTTPTLDLDTPEDLVSLSERLPVVPELLLQYEAFEGYSRTSGEPSRNTPNDRVRVSRAKAKFLKELG